MIQRFNLLVSHVIPKVSEPGGEGGREREGGGGKK